MLSIVQAVNGSTEAVSSYKSQVSRGLLSSFYVVGIVGTFLALLHLYQKANFKNTKQAFMLKCLMTLDFVGLMGMLSQFTVKTIVSTEFYEAHIWAFCFGRLVCRCFGMGSGCLAFIMAIERYFALTKPFLYCKHFTNGLIKRLVLMMWTSCAVLTFAPAFGFGIFCDMDEKKCTRYRDATAPFDVAYAFIFFFVGTFLCISMVLTNYSVTRIVYRSYSKMQQLQLSSTPNLNQQSIKLRHQDSSKSNTPASKSISLITVDEIKFINMCDLLTASFVTCWGCQMITIPISQFVRNANQYQGIAIFYRIADFLLLIHFTMDPYIYVLLRTNYWIRFKGFTSRLLFKRNDEFAELPKADQDHHF